MQMIVFYLIISPLFYYSVRIFNLSLTLCIVYVFIFYVLTRNLSRVNVNRYLNPLNLYLLNNRITQYLVFYALSFENVLLSYPIFAFIIFFCFTYFVISSLYVSPDPKQGLYWLVFTLHFYLTSYLRLRFKILNDYCLDLYKGRPAFNWSDIVVEMTRFSGLPIENRLISKSNKTFSNIIPKRGMRRVAEKVIENPESQKVLITTGVAVVAAGVAATGDLLSSPETRAIKEKEELLKNAEEEQKKAWEKLTTFPKYSELATDTGKETRKELECDAATANNKTRELKRELSDLREKASERNSLPAPDPEIDIDITDFLP